MVKLVVLKVGNGDFLSGFPVILQIGEVGDAPTIEAVGRLPSAPDLPQCYQHWQMTYRALRLPQRLGIRANSVQHLSWDEDCRVAAQQLCDRTVAWLRHPDFQPLYNRLLEQLSPQDTVRLVLQTENVTLRRLPWHHWDFFERYPLAELTLSTPAYEQILTRPTQSRTVRVLAIFGDGTGLDLETDRSLLEGLPGIELCLLTAPSRQRLTQALWSPQGWDILFFAGHSNSFQSDEGTPAAGQIGLNPEEQLTIPDLKYALQKAVKRGLAIAIFNSCDGLGLAQDLAELHIPQVLVMREPVPDPVAHTFLNGFLDSFARGQPLHLALREAREQLQGIEDHFPCAAWLPVLCQSPAQHQPSWASLQGRSQTRRSPWPAIAGTMATVAVTLGVELLGGLQPLELTMYDALVRWRPRYEEPDDRIVVIKNTQADIPAEGRAANPPQSMDDATLLRILEQLEGLQPKVVGLDIYRPVEPSNLALRQYFEQMPNLVAVCKHPAESMETVGIAPPADNLLNRFGFSDLPEGEDLVLRRWIAASGLSDSICPTNYAFALVIAAQYLNLVLPNQSLDEVVWDYDSPVADYEAQIQLDETLVPVLFSHTGGFRLPEDLINQSYQTLINYRHRPRPEEIAGYEVPVTAFLEGDFDADRFRDRIVLIGTTDRDFGRDTNNHDVWRTPYTTTELLEDETPGVYIQAHLISQLISAVEDGRPLMWTWSESGEKLWILAWGLMGGGLVWRLADERKRLLGWVVIVAEAGLILVCWGTLAAFAGWLPYVPAAIAFAGSALVVYQITVPFYRGKQ